jgi:hypothetical protein
VANAALRLKPSPEMVQELMKQFQARFGGAGGRTGAGAMPAGGGAANGGFPTGGANGMRRRPKDAGMLWVLDNSGKPKALRVRIGISDGQMTEVRAAEISEGMEVIKSINLSPAEQSAQQGPPRMRIL